MPVYEVQGPDGKVYSIEGPAGATAEQLGSFITAQARPEPPPEQGMLKSVAAGLGSGTGKVGLGIQHYAGKALDALGAEDAGKWLIDDAAKGREKIAGEVKPFKDANPLLTGAGELTGEIAASLPVGGGIGKGVQLIAKAPAARAIAPGLDAFGRAIGSGGMTTGGALRPAADMATRIAGGAVGGGAMAGVVEPGNAGMGAAIGAALPPALRGMGAATTLAAKGFRPSGLPAVADEAVAAAQQAGYVIPPTQANASTMNKALEGFAGKISTAQNASLRNQSVTNRLASESVGLPGDVPISVDALDAVRANAGKAYRALAEMPPMPAVPGSSVMNRPASPGFAPREALEELKQLRNDATAWHTAAARSASPDDLKKAKAAASAAAAIEAKLENYAALIGRDDLVPAMRDARQLIAKTYTVEKALNPTTGTVDAKKLGAMLTKGKPLSGGLREAGEFANRFPKAAQAPEGMGSLPQVSPLDYAVGLGSAATTGNPLLMAGILARPMARNMALSPMVQGRLQPKAPSGPGLLSSLLDQPGLLDYGVRATPLLLSDR